MLLKYYFSLRHIKGLLIKHGYSLQADESKIHEIKLQVSTLHIVTIASGTVAGLFNAFRSRTANRSQP